MQEDQKKRKWLAHRIHSVPTKPILESTPEAKPMIGFEGDVGWSLRDVEKVN